MPKQKLFDKMFEGLDDCLERAPALSSHPVLYDEHIISQDEHSQTVKKMLKTNLIVRWGKCFKFTDEPKLEGYFAQHELDVHENLHGSSLDLNKERAKIKAIGECFERLCLIHPRNYKTVEASFKEFVVLGEKAVDPALCLNFADSDLSISRKKYTSALQNIPMKWVLGEHLNSNQPAFIPYQLAFLPDIKDFGNDPMIRIPITTGTACGDEYEDAVFRGILECIERDSNMIFWLTKKQAAKVVLDVPLFIDIEKYFKRYNLELRVWDVTSDLEIPSIFAAIIDRTGIGPAISVGTKADTNPIKATLGAIYEAFHSRTWIRSLYHVEKQPKIEAKDVTDLPKRGFYWYPQDMIKHLDFLFDSPSKVFLSKMKDISRNENKMEFIINLLSKKGLNIYSVDITLSQIKEQGFAVVRTVIPELHPMHLDEDMPYHYSKRLLEKMKGEMNKIPAPFL